MSMKFNRKAQSLVGGLIGVAIAVIIGVGVAIPIVQEVLNDAATNITGLTRTIVVFIPVMLGVAILLGAVALFNR